MSFIDDQSISWTGSAICVTSIIVNIFFSCQKICKIFKSKKYRTISDYRAFYDLIVSSMSLFYLIHIITYSNGENKPSLYIYYQAMVLNLLLSASAAFSFCIWVERFITFKFYKRNNIAIKRPLIVAMFLYLLVELIWTSFQCKLFFDIPSSHLFFYNLNDSTKYYIGWTRALFGLITSINCLGVCRFLYRHKNAPSPKLYKRNAFVSFISGMIVLIFETSPNILLFLDTDSGLAFHVTIVLILAGRLLDALIVFIFDPENALSRILSGIHHPNSVHPTNSKLELQSVSKSVRQRTLSKY